MKKQMRYRLLVCVLALVPCFPCTETTPQVLAATSEEYSLRLLDYSFQHLSIATVVENIAKTECLKIMFDNSVAESVKSTQISLKLTKSSPMRALGIVFDSQQLDYEYAGDRALIVFKGKPPAKAKLTDMVYSNTDFITSIQQIGQFEGLKVRLHDSVEKYRSDRLTISITGRSALRGLELILNSRRLTYEYIDCSTIIIFKDESVRLT